MDKFVELRVEFSKLRVKHPIVVFIVIWVRVILGSFLNIVLISKNQIAAYTVIKNMWNRLMENCQDPENYLANLIILSIISIMFFFLLYNTVITGKKTHKIYIEITTFVTPVLPLLVRYSTCLLLTPCQAPLKILCSLLFLLSLLLQLTFTILCISSHKKK